MLGGRWLDPGTVDAEPAGGYGVKFHHERQSVQPEVKKAARKAKKQATMEAERLNAARAAEQGGRWLDDGDTSPKSRPLQIEQIEVKNEVKSSQTPANKEKMAAQEAARHFANSGRW